MHVNTKRFVILLTIIAALLIGVNIGRAVAPQSQPESTALTQPSPTKIQIPTPTPRITTYTNTVCGFKIAYTEGWTIGDSTEQGTLFSNEKANSAALVACKFNTPRPPLAKEKTTTVTVASVSGILFDSGATDGSPTQLFVIKHPTKNEDIYVAGDGKEFNAFLQGISFIK